MPSVHAKDGAALVVAIAIAAILLALGLTFLQASTSEFTAATNQQNAIRAELMAGGAASTAVAFLNQDGLIHPTYNSLDHAWRTYFNGAFAVGKTWMWKDGVPLTSGGVPEIPDRFATGMAGFDPFDLTRSDRDFYIPRIDLIDPNNTPATPANGYNHVDNPFVTSTNLSQSTLIQALAADGFYTGGNLNQLLLPTQQVHLWADVDLDEDGFRDAIWLPMGADRPLDRDGLDNDLDGTVDEPGEAGLFVYWGGNDGLDNDGDGLIDEDDEQRVFLTAPIVYDLGTGAGAQALPPFQVVRTDPETRLATTWTVDPQPGSAHIDVLDNNYDVMVNNPTTVVVRFNANGTLATDTNIELTNPAQVDAPARLAELRARAMAGVAGVDDITSNPKLQEIAQGYHGLGLGVRLFSTGETVSDLAGRFAVLVTDEASKVNLNVAGGYVKNDLADALSTADLLAANEPDGPIRRALSTGATTAEYETRLLPGVGPAIASRINNLRQGAASGVGFASYTGLIANRLNPADGPLAFDVSYPGYGRVDDNGNALWLAMNGIDDDGDGLVDEGLFLPAVTDPLYAVYASQLGALEGMDEPGEFQRYQPHRNVVAELNQLDDDADGAVDEIGELGDRAFKDREQLKLVNQVASGRYDALKNFVTAHSADTNVRYRFFDPVGPGVPHPYLPAARGDLFADLGQSYAVLRDGPTAFPTPSGLKFNPNFANPKLMAEGIATDWGMAPLRLSDLAPTPFLFEAVGSWARGLRQEGITFRSRNPVGNVLLESFLPTGDLLNADFDLARAQFPADLELGAHQLAVNARDFADSDYARSLSVSETPDTWWLAVQRQILDSLMSVDIIGDPDDPSDDVPLVERTITNTVAGVESIRINELMVRPVRRIEAEFDPTGAEPNFDLNLVNQYGPVTGAPDFIADVAFLHQSLPAGWTLNTTPQWTVPSDVNRNYGLHLGERSFLSTNAAFFSADPPGPVDAVTLENWVQFEFRASAMLPPGDYYLLLNTMAVGTGGLTPTVTDPDQLEFMIKETSAAGATADPILQDILNGVVDPADVRGPYVEEGGRVDQIATQARGTVWLWHERFGYESSPPGYQGRIAATVRISATEPTYVALRFPDAAAGAAFAANFFDFSQEPDHEYIELVNVAETGAPIDLSGWEVEVNSPRTLVGREVYRIPDGTQIAPGGMLLLTASKYDFAPTTAGLGAFYRNQISMSNVFGGVGSTTPPIPNPFAFPLLAADSVFTRNDDVDFVDMDGNGLPDELDVLEGVGARSGDGAVISTADVSGFTGTVGPSTKAWDRIVQLQSDQLQAVASYEDMGRVILAGGILPNYPEHDGIDNDGDNDILQRDRVDNDGDRLVEELLLAGIILDEDFGGENDLDENGEGIDEGRWFIDNGHILRNIGELNGEAIPGIGVPGAYNDMPTFYGVYPLNENAEYPGNPTVFGWAFEPVGAPGGYPAYMGYAEYDGTYNFLEGDAPEWKHFMERRWYPGDVVFVTLYEGGHQDGRVVDQVTYTEQDVTNAAIDDILPIPAGTNYQPLHQAYRSFWPSNTMFFDFYKALERKHPLYHGDRFGYTNRWMATDGAYDDWAPALSVFERTTNAADEVVQVANRLDSYFSNPAYLRQYVHALNGSPLRPNYYQRLLENFPEAHPGVVVPGGQERQFVNNPLPDPDTNEDLVYALTKRWGFDRARVRNNALASTGDLMTLSHYRDALDLRLPLPVTSFGQNYLVDGANVNRAYLDPNLGPGDLSTPGELRVRRERLDGVLVSHNFLDVTPEVGTDPLALEVNEQTVLLASLDATQLDLTVGQASYRSLTNQEGDFDALNLGYADWDVDNNEPPITWAPVFLYRSDATDANDNSLADNPDAEFLIQANVDNRALFNGNYLFRATSRFSSGLSPEAIFARWPAARRAVVYATRNPIDPPLAPDPDLRATGTVPNLAEGFFEWDGNAGVANGEYDVYLVFADDMTPVAAAAVGAASFEPAAPPMLDEVGQDLVRLAAATPPGRMAFDVELFTDRDGDRNFFVGPNGDTVNIARQARFLDRGLPGQNRPDFLGDPGDSLGFRAGVRPGPDGIAYYGLVRVENNRLGLFIRNWSPSGVLARFSRIILAPRGKEWGRINVNTAETRVADDGSGNVKAFNPLMGVPGIMARKQLDPTTGIGRFFGAIYPQLLNPVSPGAVTSEFVLPLFTDLPAAQVDDGAPTADIGQAATGTATDPNRLRADAARMLQRAQRVADGRLLASGAIDGRYYQHESQVVQPAPLASALFNHVYPVYDYGPGSTSILSDVSTIVDQPSLSVPAQLELQATLTARNFDESRFRYRRSANLLTSRSDVYEIIVLAQPGELAGEDLNGDGFIDYRNDFLATAEKKIRVVYER